MPRNQKGTAQIGKLRGARAARPRSAYHEKITADHSRLLPIRLSCALTQPAGTSAPSAQEFVNKVAISDIFEIQSSQLALSKQADSDTKPFAEKMVQDHSGLGLPAKLMAQHNFRTCRRAVVNLKR